ncbi:thymidine phosphorylase [Ruminococcus flavefaciens]|uniref:thymidine phosphorylase n=1 Tax=Ruminococcus flavefaciens TaxID=1265 RepID=UPI0026EDEDDF|nr:thymidine phosphorylase [Ruminococcus flavefaciens]
MNIIDIINKTKKSLELNEEEINWLVKGFTDGEIPDYQMSAWLMAVCLNGLTEKETFALTAAMRDSGDVLRLNIPFTADKHSTGGVGDKTSLIIGPIVAACGVCMAKMSGRGLGHTGGTIDKLESIEGYRTDLPINEFENILAQTGFSIISQTGELCPADKKMYALRNATGTVDSIPLICASIMSKKLAMNADCLVLDVKYGSGAFMKNKKDAEKLAELMEKVGRSAGKKCKAVVTDMNSPLGKNIGNALEVKEAVEVLQGKVKGTLYDVCIELAADILELADKSSKEECIKLAENAVASGKALDILRETIKLHGGNEKICDDVTLLPQPLLKYEIRATKDMKILGFNCEELGMTSLLLGAGRLTQNDKIDMSAGIIMNCEIGDQLAADDVIMTLYSTVCSDFSDAAVRALNAVKFKITEKPSYT